ncbi:M28 family metallopeptidase [Clostridium grantii]|uniref:Peptidase family M28 n=1 Tax=Clostridium grantii DSM 8605 TaxID=1121316 RepID=A0A1M5THT8_9CLOT|nr:M28 family metallopeptidase [Clostridium grantii]SHH50259.1 Peptidase family M28 [Clostridium grantii DSM 8605]
MKKLLEQIITCLASLMLVFSFNISTSIHDFSSYDTYENIKYMSSDYFKGRLTGTLENREIEEYIKLKFLENDLKPFMEEYTDSFTTSFPEKINGQPYLFVSDGKGNKIEEFAYGKDFKEDMMNFKNNKFTFSKNSQVYMQENILQANDGDDLFLIYSSKEQGLKFRSSFLKDCPWSMCIIVEDSILNKIKEYVAKGYYINGFVPYKTSETTISNVMGLIEGKNPDKHPIIISAHFDHLGTDLNNTIYNGALDNASGTAFMLELIKYLKSLGTPDRDILFVAFNAEEFGCVGSEEFVSKYKNEIQNSKVFNFDMIGSNNAVPLTIMGGVNDNEDTSFMRSISATCHSEDIQFKYLFQDSSDHKAFRTNNIDAITFCDDDISRIHTPNDTIDNIDIDNIDRCYLVASKQIIKNAFGGNPLLMYYKQIISVCILIILIIFIKNLISKK